MSAKLEGRRRFQASNRAYDALRRYDHFSISTRRMNGIRRSRQWVDFIDAFLSRGNADRGLVRAKLASTSARNDRMMQPWRHPFETAINDKLP